MIKVRLTILSILQFYVWGAWLITFATYFFSNDLGTGKDFGQIFSYLAIASIIMPPLTGIIADRWINAERLYGILHILYGATLFWVAKSTDVEMLKLSFLVAMLFYMPTISLSNSVTYTILKSSHPDVGNTAWKSDGSKFCTTSKSPSSDRSNTTWKNDTCQSSIIIKSKISD